MYALVQVMHAISPPFPSLSQPATSRVGMCACKCRFRDCTSNIDLLRSPHAHPHTADAIYTIEKCRAYCFLSASLAMRRQQEGLIVNDTIQSPTKFDARHIHVTMLGGPNSDFS